MTDPDANPDKPVPHIQEQALRPSFLTAYAVYVAQLSGGSVSAEAVRSDRLKVLKRLEEVAQEISEERRCCRSPDGLDFDLALQRVREEIEQS